MDKKAIKEAYEIINEWGINEDDFITQKLCRFMSDGGDPDDNSIELSEIYRTQLQIIVDLGLQEAKNQLSGNWRNGRW